MQKKQTATLFMGFAAVLFAGCEEHYLADTVSFTDEITRVDIQLDASEIRIDTAEGEETTVDYDVSYRGGTEPRVTATVADGVLKVRMKCSLSCDGDFILNVPTSSDLNVSVDSGNIEVMNIEGDGRISADSGNIRLRNLSGDLALSADSGSISGTVASAVCEAGVDSGNINLRFSEVPEQLTFSADSGNIDIAVPSGPYDVRTSVDSGKVSLRDITVDSGADARISASVDSGNIDIEGY